MPGTPSGVQLFGQVIQLCQVPGPPGVIFLERGCGMFPHPLVLPIVLIEDLGENLSKREVAGSRG